MVFFRPTGLKFLVGLLLLLSIIALHVFNKFIATRFPTIPIIGSKSKQPVHLYLTSADEELLEEKLAYAEKHRKVILAWNGIRYHARYIRPKSSTLERECGSCRITTDGSYANAEDTAAIVINYQSIRAKTLPPRHTRRSDQLYVFQAGEAPPLLKQLGGFKNFNRIDSLHFNATMLVWRESNIYGPFGSARKAQENVKSQLREKFSDNIENVIRVKSKMAVVVMSNCKSTAGAQVRLAFVRALSQHGLNVEKFGRCFKTELPRSDNRLYTSDHLIPYKFYLSFENSFHCKDYITEKFYSNGLSNFAVPVVWGAAKEDCLAVAPPNSFIHVDDFESVQDLVKYLKFLDQNDDAYLEYFKWLYYPPERLPQYQRKYGFCQLCRFVHGINIDDVYHSNFDINRLERPLIAGQVSRRSIPAFQELIDSIESEECFWKIEDFKTTNRTIVAEAARKYL